MGYEPLTLTCRSTDFLDLDGVTGDLTMDLGIGMQAQFLPNPQGDRTLALGCDSHGIASNRNLATLTLTRLREWRSRLMRKRCWRRQPAVLLIRICLR